MLSRSFAGAFCAAALIAASSSIAAPTARAPQPTYSSGGGFFANFFAMLNHVPRTVVSFPTNQRPGTVIVRTNERRLYLVLGNGQALRYGIGVGREGFTWSGVATVTAKREWPDWTPPEEMLRRKPELPRHMAGGPDNPLGARALSRRFALPHPRLERAMDDRHRRHLGLHPADQRRRDRSLQPRPARRDRDRAEVAITSGSLPPPYLKSRASVRRMG